MWHWRHCHRSRAKAGAETTGLDFSKAMLKVAAKRNLKLQISNLKFLTGDAQNLPFENQPFDIVTVGYGLRNLSSWQRGLEEMHRVAKPGARILVLEFGKPDNALLRAIYFGYLKLFRARFSVSCFVAMPRLTLISTNRCSPILPKTRVAAHMRQLGCKDVSIVNLSAAR